MQEEKFRKLEKEKVSYNKTEPEKESWLKASTYDCKAAVLLPLLLNLKKCNIFVLVHISSYTAYIRDRKSVTIKPQFEKSYITYIIAWS